MAKQMTTPPQRGQGSVSNDPEEFGPEEHRQRKRAHPGPIFHICVDHRLHPYRLLFCVEITQAVIAAVY